MKRRFILLLVVNRTLRKMEGLFRYYFIGRYSTWLLLSPDYIQIFHFIWFFVISAVPLHECGILLCSSCWWDRQDRAMRWRRRGALRRHQDPPLPREHNSQDRLDRQLHSIFLPRSRRNSSNRSMGRSRWIRACYGDLYFSDFLDNHAQVSSLSFWPSLLLPLILVIFVFRLNSVLVHLSRECQERTLHLVTMKQSS